MSQTRAGSARRQVSRARARANARARRRRGEVGVRLRVVALALGGLLAAGLVGGGALGIYLDRSGLLDRLAGWMPRTPWSETAQATFAAFDPSLQRKVPGAPSKMAEARTPQPAATTFARFEPAAPPASEPPAGPAEVMTAAAPDPIEQPVREQRLAAAPGTAEAPVQPATTAQLPAAQPGPPLGSVGAVSLAALVAETVAPQSAPQRAVDLSGKLPPEAAPSKAALDDAAQPELHVVYEEPVAASELAPPPSEQALDSFVEERRLAGLGLAGGAWSGLPPWQRNAVQVADIGDRPMIALVLDDLGLNRPNTRRAVALRGPLTLAFMTYAQHIDGMLAAARAGGHELLVHLPMEPRDPHYDPGPNVLSVDLTPEEIARRMAWGLSRFDGYVGINNHMGSRFSTSLPGMAKVMEELKRRGLLFLDSKTANASVGGGLAERLGVPHAERDIFIDNDYHDRASIRRQLKALEALARRRGFAVGIGHPHSETLEVLEQWLPAVQRRGFALVPISAVVRRRIELAHAADGAG